MRLWLAVATVVAATVLSSVAYLVQQGAVTVHECVAGGDLGGFGLALALLRTDPSCPDGLLAVGGEPRHVIGVVVLVAIPVLFAHLVAAMAGVGVVTRLHRMLRGLVALLRTVCRIPATPPLRGVVRVVVDVAVETSMSRAVVGVPWWRGPPQVQFA